MTRQEKAGESTGHVQAAHPTITQCFVFSTALAANQRPQTRGRWGESGSACPMAPPTPSRHHAFQALSHSAIFILPLVLGFTLFPAGYTPTLSILLFFLYSQSAKLQTENHLS